MFNLKFFGGSKTNKGGNIMIFFLLELHYKKDFARVCRIEK